MSGYSTYESEGSENTSSSDSMENEYNKKEDYSNVNPTNQNTVTNSLNPSQREIAKEKTILLNMNNNKVTLSKDNNNNLSADNKLSSNSFTLHQDPSSLTLTIKDMKKGNLNSKSSNKMTKKDLAARLEQSMVSNYKSTPEWVERYREQERERYRNPTKSWMYELVDGQKVIVAPVAKKMTAIGIVYCY